MDFSSKKKKKPKKKAEEAEDDEEADVTDGVAAMAMEDDDDDDDDDDDGGDDGFDDDGAGGFVSIPADREYKYEELLDRMYSLLHANNPELAGDRKRFLIKPPQVVREGSKRVVLTNFGEICKTLNRSMDHVYAFMLAEMGTTGSIDASSRMVIKGRFPPKAIEQVGPRGRAKPPARCPPHTVPAARVATCARSVAPTSAGRCRASRHPRLSPLPFPTTRPCAAATAPLAALAPHPPHPPHSIASAALPIVCWRVPLPDHPPLRGRIRVVRLVQVAVDGAAEAEPPLLHAVQQLRRTPLGDTHQDGLHRYQ